MIKNRLKVLCAERDMSLRQLARAMDIHYTTVYRFADDRTSLISKATLDAVCNELGVGPGDVFIYIPDEEAERFRRGR
jgi:DNA-binding Xre family transcriptional regulator